MDKVYVGVILVFGINGVVFILQVQVLQVDLVLEFVKQVVYLNFNVVNGVDVNYCMNLSYLVFDVEMLGSVYVGEIEIVKVIILE